MKKSQLIESVRQLVLKQQPTQDSLKQAHPMVIAAEISKAYNTVVKSYLKDNVALMETELDFYCKKYPLSVSNETYDFVSATGVTTATPTGRRYVTLTARPIELKKNLGIRNVKPLGGSFSFVRSTEGEVESIKTLDVYCCTNNVFYYIDGTKIVFESGIAEFNLFDKVVVKMMPIFEDFDDEDYIEFPVGEEQAMQMILQLVGVRPTDATNDGIK